MNTTISHIIHELFGVDVPVVLTRPDEQFGDYATSVALQLAKPLGKNPREVAEQIAEKLRAGGELAEVSVAGPGFINLTLTDAVLIDALDRKPAQPFIGKKVVIETNNPNPFKPMHIGHAFNAVLGETIANLLETGGAEVHRVSYHGDVGTHVGKSMWALLKYVHGDTSRLQSIATEDRNAFMSKMYVEGAAAYKENEQAKQEINQLTQQSFSLSDPLYKEIYDTVKKWSFEELARILERLGNQPTERQYMESEADALGVETVRQHVGNVFIESNGALVFPGSKYGAFDNVFVASSGRGLYAARDLGLMQLKNKDYHPDKSYIVTAEEQRDYFKGVIKAAELCLPELNNVTVSISTGTLKLTTGKMSSRTGDVVQVDWLFDHIAEAVKERGGDPQPGVIAGALRYPFLKIRIGSDVVFDIHESVSLQGNSGPYLQYTHARARSILSKSGQQGTKPVELQPGERSLLRKITEYQEVVEKAAAELMPHYITTYLYELAQAFNSFYEHNRVIEDERQAERLWLVNQYADRLKSGLGLLGIEAPEKM